MLLRVTLMLAATAAGGWVLTRQLVELATRLPDYKQNIQTKLRSIKMPTGARFTRSSAAVERSRPR